MSAAKPLMDAAARHRIVTDVRQSLMVEAAAGTGKTRLLIERILNLIRKRGALLSRVVAITFTEKAARELRERLRAKLQETEIAAPGGTVIDALAELDVMPVNTIHGFCADLIRQQPVEAGVDPDFNILDEDGEDERKGEFWSDWLSRELEKGVESLRPFLETEFRLESVQNSMSLRRIFDVMTLNIDTIDDFHVDCPSIAQLKDRLKAVVEDCRRHLAFAREHAVADDKLRISMEALDPWLAIDPEEDADSILPWLAQAPTFSLRTGAAGKWSSKESLDRTREWIKEYRAELAGLRQAVWSVRAAHLIDWLRQAAVGYTEAKRADGLLGFQDLLITARNLLRDNPDARSFLKSRYDFLLIDEFQDTDPLQTEIIFYLAEQPSQHAGEWTDVVPVPGKLFIVGDPKQSIYRFRRADLDLYGRVKGVMQSVGDTETIQVNFRSVEPNIEEINRIFAPLMRGEIEGRYEPEYVAMAPHRQVSPEHVSVDLLPPPPSYKPDLHNTGSARTAEAAVVAGYITELIQSGREIELDGETRALSWRDVAVLFRSWSHSEPLEHAFRALDIPYELSSGRRFGQRSEVLSLLTTLSAIANPHDEVSVVGALRSSLLGCSDDLLARHRLAGHRFDYLESPRPGDHLGLCLDLLLELRVRSARVQPSEVILELLDRTRHLQLLALKPQGQSRIANLNRLIDYVRRMESEGNRSLHQIVRHLRREQALEGAGDSIDAGSGGDRVRLMSFHKAKGLEFPVGILFALGAAPRGRDSSIYDRETGCYEFRAGSIETSGYQAAQNLEQRRSEEEEKRLLYVAMTRARDLLVIPLYWAHGKSPAPKSYQTYFSTRYPLGESGVPSVEGTAARLVDTDRYPLSHEPRERLQLDFDRPFTDEAVAEAVRGVTRWQETKRLAIEELDHRCQFGRPSAHPEAESSLPTAKSDPSQANGTGIGTVVHDVLERTDLRKASNLDTLLNSIADRVNLDEAQRGDAKSLIRRALNSDLIRIRLPQALSFHRELPFAAELDHVLYDGRMDLVLIEVDGAVIVDYKTDHVEAAHVESRAQVYSRQAAVYARALEQVTGQPVKEVILFFLRPDVQHSLSRDQLLGLDLKSST